MTPERWQRMKELFDAALEQEPDARARFLSQATPDRSLASEVLDLLAPDQEAVAAQETRRPKADRARLAQSSCERYGESLLLWRGLSGPTPSSHFDVGPPGTQRVAADRALERCPHLP